MKTIIKKFFLLCLSACALEAKLEDYDLEDDSNLPGVSGILTEEEEV